MNGFGEIGDTYIATNGTEITVTTGIKELKAASENRMLFARRPMMRPRTGLTFTAEEVISSVRNDGYVGLKFWFGFHDLPREQRAEVITLLVDPRLESFFTALERENILLASLHIENAADFRSFMDKYPGFTISLYETRRILVFCEL